ncbi:MAG TPA: rod shape-determining protein MreD [Steroidobacteraceae bacterium]|nr:rod shape-determining protein MreD [Steroidobacteraceae bacterium]
MIERRRDSIGRVLLSLLVALILSLLPLPLWLTAIRPAFLVLTVMYWSIAVPRLGGIGLGFFSGLALDVFRGAVLGQNALALSAITYVAVREHQKIRLKPAFQQALIMLGALVVYEFILFAIDGWTGHPMTSPLRWLHALTGALIWPFVTAVLDRLRNAR